MAPKKRKQQKRSSEAPVEGSNGHAVEDRTETENPAGHGRQIATARLQAMQNVARRRAAHFAHFQTEEDDEQQEYNIHVGGSEARTLGPWASARELDERRADALEARKQKLLEMAREMKSDVEWEPRSCEKAPTRKRKIGTLFESCVSLLVEYIDCIESLEGVPDSIRVRLADGASATRMMSAEVARIFVSGAPREVVLKNLTQCDESSLLALLEEAATPRLQRMELGLCGRGFGDRVAESLGKHSLGGLQTLILTGAYRVSDEGVRALLRAAPNLRRLGLPDGCRLQDCVSVLPEACPLLEVADLQGCRGLAPEALTSGLLPLKNLRELRLDAVSDVDDGFLAKLGQSVPLSRLSINQCTKVTDEGIAELAKACGASLEALSCDDVSKIGDGALKELSEHCPSLRELRLQRCHRLTDAGLALVAANGRLEVLSAADVPSFGGLSMKMLADKCYDTLLEIDISWCHSVTDNMLGLLADSCRRLTTVKAWGCSSITKKFVEGHSSETLVSVLGPG